MQTRNTKVNRMLGAMATVLKDENPKMIEALHAVINDARDGYEFDFIRAVENCKPWIHGASY